MEQEKNNAAKYAFFYMLSLVALIFMSLSTGIIVFQIINKNIVDALQIYSGQYSSGALKFAISALIISAPIYYLAAREINKNLFSGKLEKDSGIRKWLTYFILLVSSLVMLGWLVAIIFNFLDGELTIKFILKALTAIVIAAAVFSYYFYDIKREIVVGVENKIIKEYFYGSLIIVIAALISAFIFVESPIETRNIKHDVQITNDFSQIDSGINEYYLTNKKLPDNLDTLLKEITYLREENLIDPSTKNRFDYKVIDEKNYELCATFMVNSKDYENKADYYLDKRWGHDAGYQCLKQKVFEDNTKDVLPMPTR
jgi:hypothetical protein